METTIDAAGRIVVPKPLRDELGLAAGTKIDISIYGTGLSIIPVSRTATLVMENGHLVATGDRTITDEEMYALIDASRR